MNSLGICILLLINLIFILQQALAFLNVRYAKDRSVPEEMASVFDEERYRKAVNYLEVTTRVGLWAELTSLVIFFAFWGLGGFGWLDALTRSFGYSEIVTGLLFIGVLALAQSLSGLPWKIYRTFVVEERFGFNRTAPKTFVADLVKGLGLTLVLGAPLLAAVQAFFLHTGPHAWLYVWLFLTLVQVVLLFVAPVWLMPLFFKFTPLGEGDLKNAIEAYAARVGFTLKGIFVIDGSRRSNKANAFFTGFGKTKRIALFDTLVHKTSVEEIVAVLAHEVGHSKRGHIIKGFVLSTVSSGIMFFILGKLLYWQALYEAFYVQVPSVHAGLVFASIVYAPLATILAVLTSAISRKFEFEADAFAKGTADPSAMVSALKKLSELNLSNLNPHPWVVKLEYSHPPVVERIRALRT